MTPALRKEIALAWLRIFAAIDREVEPSYGSPDPKASVLTSVLPPRG